MLNSRRSRRAAPHSQLKARNCKLHVTTARFRSARGKAELRIVIRCKLHVTTARFSLARKEAELRVVIRCKLHVTTARFGMERSAAARMRNLELQYDAEEDALEVTFAEYDERFSRTIALNDHLFMHTDPGLGGVWGLTFYSYSRLLGVSETEFTALRELSDAQIDQVLALISQPPASHFFDLTLPDNLVARMRTPNLEELIDYVQGE